LEYKSHCEEQSDEANYEIRLLCLRLAMTYQVEGEGDKGGEVVKVRKGLYRAGLIVGLVGAVWLTLFALATSEAPFSWYAVPMAVVLVVPFLVGVAIAWKWPLIGGILLIAASLFWAVWRYTTVPPMPLADSLYMIAIGILPVSLPLLASGILFLLSGRGVQVLGKKTNRNN